MAIKFGCQTYTWQMSGDRYLGELDRIMGVAARAGFAGLECEMQFLGKLRDPALMQEVIDREGIDFAALCVVHDWNGVEETETEKADADFCIDYLARNFPDTILSIVPFAGPDRERLRQRQDNHIAVINAVASRAADRGVTASYHPNSVPGSTCITEADYAIMMDGIDDKLVGWCPDIFHIRGGGMDPVTILERYRSLINHVHYSDLDDDMTPQAMGEGSMDFESVTKYLVGSGYDGWLVVEDHCKRAETDPDGVTMGNGRYFAEKFAPLLAGHKQ